VNHVHKHSYLWKRTRESRPRCVKLQPVFEADSLGIEIITGIKEGLLEESPHLFSHSKRCSVFSHSEGLGLKARCKGFP
jgi:hypothetical protein